MLRRDFATITLRGACCPALMEEAVCAPLIIGCIEGSVSSQCSTTGTAFRNWGPSCQARLSLCVRCSVVHMGALTVDQPNHYRYIPRTRQRVGYVSHPSNNSTIAPQHSVMSHANPTPSEGGSKDETDEWMFVDATLQVLQSADKVERSPSDDSSALGAASDVNVHLPIRKDPQMYAKALQIRESERCLMGQRHFMLERNAVQQRSRFPLNVYARRKSTLIL